jgi:hypothetical protein
MYYSYEYGNVYVLIMYMFVGGYGSVRCPVRCRDSLLFFLCIGSLLHGLKKARESCANMGRTLVGEPMNSVGSGQTTFTPVAPFLLCIGMR